jgi:hypothetical protein
MTTTLSPGAHAAVVQGLTSLMEGISERGYCAGWMMNLEYDLWQCVQDGRPIMYGLTELTQETLDALRELSVAIDGWVTYDDGYVPMAEWLEQAKAHVPW